MKLDADIHLVVERSLRLVACSLVLKTVVEPTEQQGKKIRSNPNKFPVD